ncbi:MAG: hypothetical protein HY738_09920 [Bacteroidia bacterium]|nr:hypothetical protein [Bacteroidia bacterium]
MELATKIYTPSYISLETVLIKDGIIFQHYDSIFVVSYLSREIECDGQRYIYHKIKNAILMNHKGLYNTRNYFIASKERAVLDAAYIYREYHFDNLAPINKVLCNDLLAVYQKNSLTKKINKIL